MGMVHPLIPFEYPGVGVPFINPPLTRRSPIEKE
jgi:hypothetical protein